nr:MAG TPA: hypothetical protein [Caudoviricetes sp.]
MKQYSILASRALLLLLLILRNTSLLQEHKQSMQHTG